MDLAEFVYKADKDSMTQGELINFESNLGYYLQQLNKVRVNDNKTHEGYEALAEIKQKSNDKHYMQFVEACKNIGVNEDLRGPLYFVIYPDRFSK
jgi:hypothetical protein